MANVNFFFVDKHRTKTICPNLTCGGKGGGHKNTNTLGNSSFSNTQYSIDVFILELSLHASENIQNMFNFSKI